MIPLTRDIHSSQNHRESAWRSPGVGGGKRGTGRYCLVFQDDSPGDGGWCWVHDSVNVFDTLKSGRDVPFCHVYFTIHKIGGSGPRAIFTLCVLLRGSPPPPAASSMSCTQSGSVSLPYPHFLLPGGFLSCLPCRLSLLVCFDCSLPDGVAFLSIANGHDSNQSPACFCLRENKSEQAPPASSSFNSSRCRMLEVRLR